MKALIHHDDGHAAHISQDRPVPKVRDTYVLIKTVAVALNPADWKTMALGLASNDSLVGGDFSGIVEEVGGQVTKSLKKGDRVCGVTYNSDGVSFDVGGFAEYILAKGDLLIKIPEGMAFEQAATLGAGAATIGQGLYQSGLKMVVPGAESGLSDEKGERYVLIYGGSSATGALAIQFAKLSGYTVITTCSWSNFTYVESLGADKTFDYNDPKAAAQIRALTDNQLTLVYDTVGTESSASFCANALSTSAPGCRYCSVMPAQFPRGDVENVFVSMMTIFGEPVEIPGFFSVKEGSKEDFEFAKMFRRLTEGLLAEGKIRPHRAKVGKGGLEGVLDGLEELKSGKVSGYKLVYVVDETP